MGNYRITRTRVQKQPPRFPNSLRKNNGVNINKEQRSVFREPITRKPEELKLQNSLILNSDGLTYNVVRKQRTDLLRNSKGRTSSPTASFSSNLDIDEVTKTLPNKGRKITIVTPSTATIPRKLVLFPSTTTPQRTENTDTAFQTDNFNNRKLSSIQRKTKITN